MSLKAIIKNSTDYGGSELSRIDYLDGWRGLAIILVLLSHFAPIRFIDLGRMGVDVFFVLSGMLMSNILFCKKVPLNVFYKKRISRVFPVFFVYVSLLYLVSYIADLSSEHGNYFYTLLFIRTYFPAEPNLWATGIPIGHVWSLNVEEHCYILLSLITLVSVFKKKEYIPLIMLGLVAIIIQYIYESNPAIAPKHYRINTEVVASHLLISSGYFLIKHRFEKFIPPWLPLATLALAFLCYFWQAASYSTWIISPFLLAFTVNHLNLIPSIFKRLLEYKPLRLIGLWSYSIYLWNMPLYYYGIKHNDSNLILGIVLMIASIVIGALSFYSIEKPVRKYLNTHW